MRKFIEKCFSIKKEKNNPETPVNVVRSVCSNTVPYEYMVQRWIAYQNIGEYLDLLNKKEKKFIQEEMDV